MTDLEKVVQVVIVVVNIKYCCLNEKDGDFWRIV